jgi:hypothetical protein
VVLQERCAVRRSSGGEPRTDDEASDRVGADLGFTTYKKKRMKIIKSKMAKGLLDPDKDDPFELFISSTDIRCCRPAASRLASTDTVWVHLRRRGSAGDGTGGGGM